MITQSDINLVLSGGSNNTLASSSLGGEPSNTLVGNSINNLFGDISSLELAAGKTDYRCFYVFNDSETDIFYNCKIYINSQAPGGATVQLGLKRANDIQVIHVESTDPISTGTMNFSIEGNLISLNYSLNLGDMSQELEDAINSYGYGATVSPSSISEYDFSFAITFSGYKYFDLFTLVSQDLVTAGSVDISISKNTIGSPVNTFAEQIDNEKVAPNGVVFQATVGYNNAIEVADLRPGEGFPVWVKRTILPNAQGLQNDNFVFILMGSP